MPAYKRIHEINVHDDAMQITSKKTIISGGIGVDYIKFNLSDVWAELDVNIFMSNGVSDAYRFNYTGEHIAIPAELISEPGILDIGIVGYKDNARVTVAKLVTPFTVVMQSVNGEKEPPQPVEDIYADITGALNDTKELQDKVDKALTVLDDLAHAANEAINNAIAATTAAKEAATKADTAADNANEAADNANEAAVIAGEKTVEVFNDPVADDRVIIKYPSFLKSDDCGSIYMNVSGGDYNG